MTGPRASPNRALLERVARRVGPLLDDLVFVGGHVTELLVTDPGAPRIRPTDDVDVVVATATRSEYYRLGEQLRKQGFREDTTEGAPLCRWRSAEGAVLDVMPTSGEVLGFTNRWYPHAIATAIRYDLAPGLAIRIASPSAFLATKWAAFDGRGGGDHLGSHDVEDIVAVVAGRAEIIDDVARSEPDVRTWLSARTRRFLDHPDSGYAIEGALPDARFDSTLIQRIRARFEAIARG